MQELDRLAEDLDILDREIAQSTLDALAIKRLITITGVNLTVAAGIMAVLDDIGRFKSPGKLVSYFGLNPECVSRTWGLSAQPARHCDKAGQFSCRC